MINEDWRKNTYITLQDVCKMSALDYLGIDDTLWYFTYTYFKNCSTEIAYLVN